MGRRPGILIRMRFQAVSEFACTPAALWGFHERPDALALLTPKWPPVKVIQPPASLHVGAEAILELHPVPGVRIRWHARHTEYDPPHRFVDVQLSGPFASWRHEHRIEPAPGGARLIDTVEYEPPLGVLGKLANPLFIRPQLKAMFRYRHAVTRRHVEQA